MNNRTKERKFVADNALLFLHLQVYDFLIHKDTVANDPLEIAISVKSDYTLKSDRAN